MILKKWLGLALLAIWLGQGMQASAQYLPSEIGAARIPDPTPIQSRTPVPKNLIPGPITPEIAPPGPPDEMTLPENHSNAFPADYPEGGKNNVTFSAGMIGLKRNGLPSNFIGVTQPISSLVQGVVNVPIAATLTTVAVPPFIFQAVPPGIPANVLFSVNFLADSGIRPDASATPIGDFGNLDTPFATGFRGGAMVFSDDAALEIGGFFVGRSSKSTSVVSPSIDTSAMVQSVTIRQLTPFPDPPVGQPNGTIVTFTGSAVPGVTAAFGRSFSQLHLPFVNAPAGFGGNNNLWLQADAARVDFSNKFATVEANARLYSSFDSSFEWIFGVRYSDQSEELDHTTIDDLFNDINNPTLRFIPNNVNVTLPVPANTPLTLPRRVGDPTVTATYGTRVKNRIIGPQVGFEGHFLPFSWLALSYMAKGSVGVNLLEREVFLRRGDGVIGFDTKETLNRISQAYELSASADISLLEGMRLRLGYNAFFLVDVATAGGQIDYNLANTAGRRDSSDSTFYHGPAVELQFLF